MSKIYLIIIYKITNDYGSVFIKNIWHIVKILRQTNHPCFTFHFKKKSYGVYKIKEIYK